MLDWVLCRIKAGFLLLLFFLPIATALWHQREIARMEAITRADALPLFDADAFADADDLSDSDALGSLPTP